MPVDEKIVGRLVDATTAVYGHAEHQLIELITRQLSRDMGASDWAVRRLAQIGALRRAAAAIGDRLDVDGSAQIRRTIAAAWRSGNASAVADLAQVLTPKAVSPALAAAREHRGANVIQVIADAVVGEVRPAHARILPAVEGVYRQVIESALVRSVAGVQDRRRAAQDAWTALVDQGITSFTDSSGRRWRLHSYVEMAVRTGALRAASTALVDEYRAQDERFIYVEDRPGECALCRPWEHKVLSIAGDPAGVVRVPSQRAAGGMVDVDVAGTVEQALAAGLQHPNCEHRLRLFVPGRTRLSQATADPLGDQARQRQRAIERHLRFWREREAAAFIESDQRKAQVRIRMWHEQLLAHLAATGQRRAVAREQPGAGYVPPKRSALEELAPDRPEFWLRERYLRNAESRS